MESGHAFFRCDSDCVKLFIEKATSHYILYHIFDAHIIILPELGIIATDKGKITLFYHPATLLGKQTYAYIKASDKAILAIDLSRTKLTGTQWIEIAQNLNLKVADLIEKKHPDFTKLYGEKPIEMEEEDWLKVLNKHPEVLTYPIAVKDDVFIQIKNPSDFVKFMDPDSAGITIPHTRKKNPDMDPDEKN